jgi:hypothetical protein
MTVWRPLARSVFSHVRRTGEAENGSGTASFDISIADRGGAEIVRIEDFTMRRAEGRDVFTLDRGRQLTGERIAGAMDEIGTVGTVRERLGISTAYIAPRTETERTVVEIRQELLGVAMRDVRIG